MGDLAVAAFPCIIASKAIGKHGVFVSFCQWQCCLWPIDLHFTAVALYHLMLLFCATVHVYKRRQCKVYVVSWLNRIDICILFELHGRIM